MKTLIHGPLRDWRGWMARCGRVLLGMVMLSVCLPSSAHEIPDDVKLVSQARVEGQQWIVMIRAPLGAMTEADIPKLLAPYFTASLKQSAPTLEIVAEDKIPAAYWKPQSPKLDKQGILAALKAGTTIEGAAVAPSEWQLTVRTK